MCKHAHASEKKNDRYYGDIIDNNEADDENPDDDDNDDNDDVDSEGKYCDDEDDDYNHNGTAISWLTPTILRIHTKTKKTCACC